MEKHTFVISDESVNDYGFRILTSGIDLERYKKNPVLLYCHVRGAEKGGDVLPIGLVENIRIESTQLVGELVFDESDEFAVKVESKVKKKMLNAVSPGLDMIEWSEDPALMLPGQTMPTITKCTLKEVSIADIPANGNAVKLFGKEATVSIGLSDSNPQDLDKLFINTNKTPMTMELVIAELNNMEGIELATGATEQQILSAMKKGVSTLQSQLTAKTDEVETLTTKVGELETQLADKDKDVLKTKAENLVDTALAANKIVAAEKDSFVQLAMASEDGYNSVKTILDGKKPYKPVSQQLNADELDDDTKLVAAWDEHHRKGTLEKVKLKSPEHFKAMHVAKFGKEPKE